MRSSFLSPRLHLPDPHVKEVAMILLRLSLSIVVRNVFNRLIQINNVLLIRASEEGYRDALQNFLIHPIQSL